MIRSIAASMLGLALTLIGAKAAEAPPRPELLQMQVPHWTPAQLCTHTTHDLLGLYAAGQMNGTPWQQHLMVASFKGETSTVLGALAANTPHMDAAGLQAWRNAALSQAVYAGQRAEATALLAAGADIESSPDVPNVRLSEVKREADAMLGPQEARKFAKAGLLASGEKVQVGRPLALAVSCNDVPMARMLLQHGADLYAAPAHFPGRIGYDVVVATAQREDAMLRLFLDHHLDPCRVTTRIGAASVANVARKVKLAADLVSSLECHH
jgi:stage V sporulation protein SpoVS